MRTEPDLPRGALGSVLGARYGLEVAELTFIPKGIDSWAYRATATDGRSVFVRLTRPAPPEVRMRLDAELPLLRALADDGHVRVARPIPDLEGRWSTRVEGFEVVVLTFLDGRSLEAERVWPDALYGRVAETLAGIHAASDGVRDLVPRAESYDLPFLPTLRRAMAALARDGATDADPGTGGVHASLEGRRALRALGGLLQPRAAALDAVVTRLEALRDVARDHRGDTVLCHTDLWGSNLILDADGTLAVVDWNSALVGPREADLFLFAGTSFYPAERFGWFLDRYEAAAGRPVGLDPDVLSFYLYRRNLEDLADFVDALVHGRTDAMDSASTLAIVRRLVGEWPRIDARVATLATMLRDRR